MTTRLRPQGGRPFTHQQAPPGATLPGYARHRRRNAGILILIDARQLWHDDLDERPATRAQNDRCRILGVIQVIPDIPQLGGQLQACRSPIGQRANALLFAGCK